MRPPDEELTVVSKIFDRNVLECAQALETGNPTQCIAERSGVLCRNKSERHNGPVQTRCNTKANGRVLACTLDGLPQGEELRRGNRRVVPQHAQRQVRASNDLCTVHPGPREALPQRGRNLQLVWSGAIHCPYFAWKPPSTLSM